MKRYAELTGIGTVRGRGQKALAITKSLNSKDYGVPQNRERVFVIGHSRGRGGREVFPVEGTNGENCVSVIGGVGEKNFGTQFRQGNRVHDSNGVATALGAAPVGNAGGESNLYCVPLCNTNPSGNGMNGVVYDGCGLAPALTTNKGEGNKVTIPVLTPDRVEKRQNGRRFKDDGEPMFTLTGQDKHGVATKVIGDREVYAVWYEKYQCYIAIRKLTPKECFRLQGWDDGSFQRAEFVNSNSQLYRQAGNGVTVPVIEAIARKMG